MSEFYMQKRDEDRMNVIRADSSACMDEFVSWHPKPDWHFSFFLTVTKTPEKRDYPIHWTSRIQEFFWRHGVSIHNFWRGECTPNFDCCICVKEPQP